MSPTRRLLIPGLAAAFLVFGLVLALPRAQAQPEGSAGSVSARAALQRPAVKPGERAVVAVEITHRDGFHTWPARHVDLPKSVASVADQNRTTIRLSEQVPGVRPLGIQWPQTHPGEVPNLETYEGTVTVPLYSDRAVAYLTLEIAPDAPPGAVELPVVLSFQACNDQTCEMPADLSLRLSLRIDPAAAGAGPGDAALFAGYRAGEIGEPVAGAETPPSGDAPPHAAELAPRTLFGVAIGGGLLLLFLASAAGGAILNLTPCVLPIIPIKVMTLVHHAGTPGRRVALGLWMALGVVAFWAALAVPVLALQGADPSQLIFGIWWVTLAIGLLIAAMGLGIMGLFTIQLPQAAYAINPKADTPWGSFVYGVMAGVLGLPCFGFVAGGLLAGATALPWEMIVTIFVGLGVGMGAPYLILSAWPALVERIPRTGPASELVKQVMGLLLIAFAAFFVTAGVKALLREMPYLSESISLWIVAFFIVLTGLWLTMRTLQIARRAWPRVVMPALSVLAAGGMVLMAARATATDREDWALIQAAGEGEIVPGAWLPYTPARLEKALASGKIVVAEFTADWCITCKFIRRTILDAEPLRSRLRQDDCVLLVVDCTLDSSPGSAYLKALGYSGVPQLAIYTPGKEKPVVYGAYTSEVVLGALENAARNAATGDSLTTGAWLPYTPARLEKALASGRVVVADFTADWDINCKFLKRTILEAEPVRSRLQKDDVILLDVDCTVDGSPGSEYLKSLGLTGPPQLAIYPVGGGKPAIHAAYTADTVLKAVEAATNRSAAARTPAEPSDQEPAEPMR